MPKSDTWPGGVATEPSSRNMDSAGSSDSMISTNSSFVSAAEQLHIFFCMGLLCGRAKRDGEVLKHRFCPLVPNLWSCVRRGAQSADSLQHLSAAERECLMYLEQTIDSLDVEDDSGLSNDEPDTSRWAAEKADHLSNAAEQRGEDSKGDQMLGLHHGVPTPFLLANGSANLPQTAPADVHERKTPEVPNDSSAPPSLETNTRDLETSETHCEVRVPDSKTGSSAPRAQMLASATDGGGDLRAPSDTTLEPDRSNPQPETDLVLFPPPSDFMDEPGPQPQLEEERPVLPISVETSGKSKGIDLEALRLRAATRRSSSGSDAIHQPVPEKSVVDVPESTPDSLTVTPANHLPEFPEPKSPPAVAPKPKKLPSNIIFKSHKPSVDTNFSPPASDRLLSDTQKVHMEALRKIGLLKADNADFDPRPSLSSPKSRKSWAAPPSPLSPVARQTPPSPSTRTSSPVSAVPVAASVPRSASMGRVSPQATVASRPAAQPTDIFPVPAAFSDAVEPPSGRSPINTCVKSATLERSGLGSSSPTVSQDGGANSGGLAELRNSRPRPASLGSGKDFSSVKLEASGSKDANARRSTRVAPVSQSAAESQGAPRYHGVSVVICPRPEHDEGRREALKKLGLLKD
ncbi:Specifically androgen-regulated gene protein [Merluccius polli]|uniref:Specifically androgen-regulated gene protein n=1 Tax=Merluccius polli TaxID=89951 RepID=A0AA47PBZ7_MERPO|nr:Specifically androgen-regulated gene protein [Merluccius polli]